MSELYVDDQFPASLESIYYDSRADPGIVWKRPKEICENPIFVDDGASKYDIAQGKLSDCWFLSAAAVLATRQELFKQIIPPDQDFGDNYTGKFTFRFWRYGRWELVDIDDRLPTKNNHLYFCHNRSTTNEFWSALLEKAYAKIHRSYQALELGFSQDALVDLTGGIGEFIDLNGTVGVKKAETEDLIPTNIARLCKRLKRLSKKQCSFLCCAIEVKSDGTFESVLDNGLIQGHAYSICKVLELSTEGGTVDLIKLRNPWGCKEWNGPWSDGSSEWESVSEEQKAELGLISEDEGEFWMTFTDFINNFDLLKICHLTPDSVHGAYGESLWEHADYHGKWSPGVTAGGCYYNRDTYWTNPQYYVRLQDPDDDEDNKCTLVVSLMQKYRRIMKTLEKTADTETSIGFDVFRYMGDEPEELDGFDASQSSLRIEVPFHDFEYLRERSKRFSLRPGTYCIIPCTFNPGVEAEFLIRMAFETPADSGEVDAPSVASVGKFDRMYEKYSGDDDVIDARELKKMLNGALKREQDEEFSKETSRALIKSIIGDHRGTLAKSAVNDVWQQVKMYQNAFDEFDKDGSGDLNIRELRKALKSVGVTIKKSTLVTAAEKYCGQSSNLSLDDFILIGAKVSATTESFAHLRQRSTRSGAGSKIELSLDEVLQMAL